MSIKNEFEIVEDLFGKYTEKFTKADMMHAMRFFANQFRWIETTCGKRLIFDDLDYEVLRKQQIFFDTRRNIAMALKVLKMLIVLSKQ